MATNYFQLYCHLLTNPVWFAHLMEKHLSFSHFSLFFLRTFKRFQDGIQATQSTVRFKCTHTSIARCSGDPHRQYRNGGRLVSSFLHHFTFEILQEHSGVFFMSTFKAFQPDAKGYSHSAWVIRHVSNKTWALLLCVFSLSWYNRTRSIPRHRASRQTFDYGPRVVELIEKKTLH